jgi:hypothetical protein
MRDKSISLGKADLIRLNARCKDRMRIPVYFGMEYNFRACYFLDYLGI